MQYFMFISYVFLTSSPVSLHPKLCNVLKIQDILIVQVVINVQCLNNAGYVVKNVFRGVQCLDNAGHIICMGFLNVQCLNNAGHIVSSSSEMGNVLTMQDILCVKVF